MGEVLCKPNKEEARRAVECSRAPPVHQYDQLEEARSQNGAAAAVNMAVPFAHRDRVPAKAAAGDPRTPYEKTALPSQSTSPRQSGEQVFVPVGRGAGDYEQKLDTKYYGCQPKRWVLVAALSISIVVIAILLAAQQAGVWGGSYGCSEDAGSPLVWTDDHKEWCCKTAEVACPTTVTTTTLPFDCKADFYDWHNLWSPGKKAWCCDHFGLGCPATTTSIPFACTSGVEHWETEWSIGKKAWCCEHEFVGCPTTPSTTTQAVASVPNAGAATTYDCEADYENWGDAWDAHKRAWCCEFKQRGCPTLAPAAAA